MFNDLFSFEGRNNRQKFWVIQLAIAGFLIAALIIDGVLFGESAGILYIVATLLIIIPSLANTIKRWHDRDKSGFWMFIALIPIIGSIWVFIETGLLAGTDGPNKYGPDPLKADKIIEKQPEDIII